MTEAPPPDATVRGMVRTATHQLAVSGIGRARHEAEWLLSRVVGMTPVELYLREEPLPEEARCRFFTQIARRSTGIPLQYLLGTADFYGRSFLVEPGVFIPRPETETIVEAALQTLRARQRHLARPLRLLDLGTGSGCIAATVAALLPPCVVVGLELSWGALRVAQANLRRHHLTDRVWLVQGSWAAPIRGRWDGILSNPPYIPSVQVDRLPREVRQEPRLSLDGGGDGLRETRTIVAQAGERLMPGGILVCECGETQVEALAALAQATPWVGAIRPLKDLADRPRGVLINKKDNGFV